MSQLILPPNVRKLETAEAVTKAAQAMERIAQMGAVGRLMTMLNNPSVPKSLKDDLREVLSDLASFEKHALNPKHAEHLTGHRNLACMVSGHITVWAEALAECMAKETEPDDKAFMQHEIDALTAIETCVNSALSK